MMINTLAARIKMYFCNKCPYGNARDFHVSYSQEGEDLLLDRLFNRKATGFYVDVGAHHPKRFSNTYLFYLRGWRGINIDAMPGSMDSFNLLRPRDINLEIAISDACKEMTFHVFNETALNTFCKDVAENYLKHGLPLRHTRTVVPQRLSDVLDRYLPENQTIDFMNVDVEGLDLQVLLSNNWEKYRPIVVLIEELDRDFDHLSDSKVVKLLRSQGYELQCKAINTLIFGNVSKLKQISTSKQADAGGQAGTV